MLKKIGLLLFSLVVIYAWLKFPLVQKIAYTGTGFSAKNICSGYFISGFDQALIVNEALIPIDSTFAYIDTLIDEKNKRVTSSIYGLFSRVATYNSATGCRLHTINQSKNPEQLFKYVSTVTKTKPANTESPQAFRVNYKPKIQDYLKLFFSAEDEAERRSKSVIVWYDGQIVGERYAAGVTRQTPLLSWSMAKSITNMLAAIRVKEGQLQLHQPTGLAEWKQQPDHQKITLDDLLRMSSGLEFNETYGIGSDAVIMLSIAPNAGKYAANKLLDYPPNSHWSYSSGTSNIVSLLIQRTISSDPQIYYQYAQDNLFAPLGIEDAILETDSEGTIIGSSYMYATTRDWLKLGLLMLKDGVWRGRQILPKGWTHYSTTASTTDLLNHYGAYFWLNYDPSDPAKQRVWPKLPTDTYYMAGFQGQRVVIIPSKQLILVKMGFTTPGSDNGVEQLVADVIKILQPPVK